ncbi:MAG: sigma-54 dependent transcriptional regulator [Gammaproteobacteria bacterium]
MINQKILVVDDEPNMRRILELILKELGHSVLIAEDGVKALAILEQTSVDLIVTDLKMPNMDGLQLLQALQQRGETAPVILITAYGTVESAVEVMKLGAFDYIIRPFELETVELSVKRALTHKQTQHQNQFLRSEIDKDWHGLIGNSPEMQAIYQLIEQVAPTKAGVLINGETGTGKELIARAVHSQSERSEALFVPINCAAIPADILESELFGVSKGAFTGAHKDRMGKFELAQGGTLFLDEITEMNQNLQAKLLRIIQEKSLERLGSNQTIDIDIRIIAATNRDPKVAVEQQQLREDLYYRLNVFTIELPPLRQRCSDIRLLAEYFLNLHTTDMGFPFAGLTPNALTSLERYSWPGNVRELENMMERAAVLSRGAPVDIQHLPADSFSNAKLASFDVATDRSELRLQPRIELLEKHLIEQALQYADGNKAKAARKLEISERSLWYKLKKYQLA